MLPISYLRKHLGGQIGADEDPILRELLNSALARVENATGRTFDAPAALTEYYSGDGEQKLELRSPVTSGTPAVYLQAGSSWSLLDSTTYTVRTNHRLGIANTLTLHSLRWPYGLQNVKVAYTGGYAAGDEPGEIRDLVADLVRIGYAGRLPGAERQELTAEQAAVLAKWRIAEMVPQPRLVRG